MFPWAVKSSSKIVPKTELKMAFIVMYEEYKKAMTAPRAEMSTYLVATEDHLGIHPGMNREQLTIIPGSEGGLNIGGQRTITGGPPVGYGDKSSAGLPGPANILFGNSAVEWQCPNDVESKGVRAEPRDLGKIFKLPEP
jgi:hypothetical protein